MSDIKSRLEDFLTELPIEAIVEDVASRSGRKPGEVTPGSGLRAGDIGDMLRNYVNETRVSFDMIRQHISTQQRILEVGAGLCLLSLFLKREGYNIVALEPALGGHELFEQARRAILAHYSHIPLRMLDCPAERLDAAVHGRFDVIFSNNVIEHIPDWQAALDAMSGVLDEHGYMLHSCPNYNVPYEPHYGVPVLHRVPNLSRRWFLASDADQGIWNSLNFITYYQLQSYCRAHGLCCSFEKGLLYKAVKRIDEDPLFRERHRGVVATVAWLLLRTGLARLLGSIPAALATPMVVRIQILPQETV